MADIELMDEHEQSELVRSWLRQNLNAILVGILVGIGFIVGWHQWKNMRASHAAEAQTQYQAFLAAVEKDDAKGADAIAAALRKDYDDTPYAAFGALRIAEQKLSAGDAKAAAAELEWARTHTGFEPLKELATLRLARVKLAAGEAQAALDLAASVQAKGYAALAAELRGDALVVLKRPADARKAYDEALTALDAAAPNRAFLEMKRDDLGTAG